MNSFYISHSLKLLFKNFNINKKRNIFLIYLFFTLILTFLYTQIGNYFTIYYLLFSLVSIFFFIDNFFLSNLVSQKFIGLFLFIGFWVKFNFNVMYNDNIFPEYINELHKYGGASISSSDYTFLNNFFISSSVFLLSITLASRYLFNFNYIKKRFLSYNLLSLSNFFLSRNYCIFYFIFSFILFIINFKYQFFVRGISPLIDNIFIISFYKIYFSFIVLILSALALDFYIKKKNNYFIIFLILLFLSINHLFYLSRLAPVLLLPLLLSLLNYIYINNNNSTFNNKKILYLIFLSFFLFFLCWYIVFITRNFVYFEENKLFINLQSLDNEAQYMRKAGDHIFASFLIERWIGADGLMTIIANKKKLSFDYFFSNSSFTFIDGRLRSVFIIGPAAFFFKSGSYIILFFSTFFTVLLIFNIENLIKNFNKNLYFFQYFYGFILAYEFIHIGGGSLKSIIYYLSLFFFIFVLIITCFFLKKKTR